jgi:glycerol-3-phosphate acyltransferase PlsY
VGATEGWIWFTLAFFSGALPLSLWLARLAIAVDLRQVGDGNPGAANVWRAGGAVWGLTAVLLDFFKGAVPVGLAHFRFGASGLTLAAIALAPIIGHAYSPLLKGRGGKALAVTFGIWAGLTLWVVPLALGLLFSLWLALLTVEGWAVVAGMLSLVPLLLGLDADPTWWLVWAGNLVLLIWKHRADLRQKPHPRWQKPVNEKAHPPR